MSDAELAGILADDRVEVFVLHVDGTPAGYFELDRRDHPVGTGGTIDLAYFGLMAHCVGRGLGRYLLHAAIAQAWRYAPERLTVNTNPKTGKASCRERVCKYVKISVVAVTLKTNTKT